MRRTHELKKRTLALLFSIAAASVSAQAQQATLNFTPEKSTVHFVLGDVLHTVQGSFKVKSGIVRFEPATNAISGEVIVDATSGDSGNGSRDHKMHKEILESAKYPEMIFRPDRVDGKVAAEGVSSVQVHGMFGIHGGEHEVTVPAQVELAPDHWNLTVHFDVPYVKWGIKDPSTFILRVQKTVAIDLHATGGNPWLTQP